MKVKFPPFKLVMVGSRLYSIFNPGALQPTSVVLFLNQKFTPEQTLVSSLDTVTRSLDRKDGVLRFRLYAKL